jgi:hypothetical protein
MWMQKLLLVEQNHNQFVVVVCQVHGLFLLA